MKELDSNQINNNYYIKRLPSVISHAVIMKGDYDLFKSTNRTSFGIPYPTEVLMVFH